MPEISRIVSEYRLLLFGGLLMLVMRFSPGGLAGAVIGVRRRLVR